MEQKAKKFGQHFSNPWTKLQSGNSMLQMRLVVQGDAVLRVVVGAGGETVHPLQLLHIQLPHIHAQPFCPHVRHPRPCARPRVPRLQGEKDVVATSSRNLLESGCGAGLQERLPVAKEPAEIAWCRGLLPGSHEGISVFLFPWFSVLFFRGFQCSFSSGFQYYFFVVCSVPFSEVSKFIRNTVTFHLTLAVFKL